MLGSYTSCAHFATHVHARVRKNCGGGTGAGDGNGPPSPQFFFETPFYAKVGPFSTDHVHITHIALSIRKE